MDVRVATDIRVRNVIRQLQHSDTGLFAKNCSVLSMFAIRCLCNSGEKYVSRPVLRFEGSKTTRKGKLKTCFPFSENIERKENENRLNIYTLQVESTSAY